MVPQTSSHGKLSTSQISVAAEAFAAAQFALSGFDVLEQAGHAQFFFDLSVARSGGMMKVSVHASFNGFWDLVDRYLDSTRCGEATAADYHRAIDLWLGRHSSRVTCCLVRFEPADPHRMPHLYLASPGEVAEQFHEKIDQLTHQELVPIGLDVVHHLEGLPASWRFSPARIAELMELPAEEYEYKPRLSEAAMCADYEADLPQAFVECMSMMN